MDIYEQVCEAMVSSAELSGFETDLSVERLKENLNKEEITLWAHGLVRSAGVSYEFPDLSIAEQLKKAGKMSLYEQIAKYCWINNLTFNHYATEAEISQEARRVTDGDGPITVDLLNSIIQANNHTEKNKQKAVLGVLIKVMDDECTH